MRFCLRKQTIFFAIFWIGLALFLTSYQNLRKFVQRHHWPVVTTTTVTSLGSNPTLTMATESLDVSHTTKRRRTTTTSTIATTTTTIGKTVKTTTTTQLDNTQSILLNTTATRTLSKRRNGSSQSLCRLDKFLPTRNTCNASLHTESKLSLFRRLPPQYTETLPAVPLPSCLSIQPWLTHKQIKERNGREILMVFLIKSAAPNFARRSMIRQTWGSIASLYEMKFLLVFALGTPANEETQNFIEKENEGNGDLLQCDFVDTYRMLPEKVLSAFGWFVKEDIDTDFVTITDDDCMMNLKNIYRAFRVSTNKDYIYCGFQYGKNRRPVSEEKSKWYISKEIYSEHVYPAFCHGGMWTLKMPLLKKLHCAAETTDRNGFHLEDVYITGILRRKVSCTESNVLDRWRFRMVKHVTARSTLYRTFLGFWRVWNRTLPWLGEPGSIPKVQLRNILV